MKPKPIAYLCSKNDRNWFPEPIYTKAFLDNIIEYCQNTNQVFYIEWL